MFRKILPDVPENSPTDVTHGSPGHSEGIHGEDPGAFRPVPPEAGDREPEAPKQ